MVRVKRNGKKLATEIELGIHGCYETFDGVHAVSTIVQHPRCLAGTVTGIIITYEVHEGKFHHGISHAIFYPQSVNHQPSRACNAEAQ